ncbi:hypothetical protein GWR56_16180 [Mucilaginibacter sp. 14171R-50]|uniref:hypothetical protein n=1 Tax=Mucilaginibacter sp. 14171R-50 TaxID=2703789 RepID=UPI00138CD84E|nr:hypothetical protein [Mucilaginibacter sp. 14171R-50]QHS57004.1 hypothetical protein GWR56_16180 [Mucilaginibacter sp. 14171R-50]
MILEEFLYRLKFEYYNLGMLTADTYYQRLSNLFVVLELDGDNLNKEHDLGLDTVLDKLNDINEEDLEKGLSPEDLAVLVKTVKTGLALLINRLEE